MNATDLRPIDFDGYRQRAQELRNEAVQRFIGRAIASVEATLSLRSRKASREASHAHPIASRA